MDILNGREVLGWEILELLGLAVLERGGPGMKHPGVHDARNADGEMIVCLPSPSTACPWRKKCGWGEALLAAARRVQ